MLYSKSDDGRKTITKAVTMMPASKKWCWVTRRCVDTKRSVPVLMNDEVDDCVR